MFSVPSPRSQAPLSSGSVKLSLALAASSLALLLSGCGITPTPATPESSVSLSGKVHGGQQPVGGAALQLYAVGTTGDGSAATPLLTATVSTSDGTGNSTNANANASNGFNSFPLGAFTITGLFHCPTPSSQVYLAATGGNPGLAPGQVNPVLSMMSVLGRCDGLTSSTNVEINELTTVGSVAPLYTYMNGYSSLGSGTSDATQFVSALDLVRTYTNTSTGTAPGPDLPSGYYASTAEVATIADILAGCVNSDGTTLCQQLFTLATPSGGTAPTDTIGAAIDILKYPTNNTAAIFALLGPSVPFQPTLPSAPAAWSLPIIPMAAAPSISPAGGSYSLAPTITITDSTPGATIYYTTDNTTPTRNSAIYTGPFNLTTSYEPTRIVRAFALAPGFGPSLASSASYTLPTPGTGTALKFLTQPVNTPVSTFIPGIRVAIVDSYGNQVADQFKGITLSLGNNPGSATLGGTLVGGTSRGDGSFTFTDISLNKIADGYTLNATSGGYASATSTAFNITPPPIVVTVPGTLIGTAATLPGTFTLPTAAPVGGLTVTLTSSNPAAITISPATVTLAAGDTKGSFTYTAIAAGTTVLRAAATSYPDGTASVSTSANYITLGAFPTVPGAAQPLSVTLSQPAPTGGLTVTLTSSATSVATVSSSVFIAAGATQPASSPTIQAKTFGTSTVTATATGYAPDSRIMNIAGTATLTQNLTVARQNTVTVTYTVSAASTTATTINLKSDNTSVATVPATVILPANATSVTFSATGAGVGSTTLHASATGIADTTTTIAVTGTLALTNGNPGVGLQSPATLTLTNPALTPVSITLTSSNPAQLLLSTTTSTTGSASITLNNITGSTVTFYEQGQSLGSATITVTSAAYTTASATTTVRQPIVSFQVTSAISPISTLASPTTFYASLGEVIGSSYFPCVSITATAGLGCAMNPGTTATLDVTDSTTTVGTINVSSATFTTTTANIPIQFTPLTAGATTIALGTPPSGYGTLSGSNSFVISVVQPTFTLPNTSIQTGVGVTYPRTGSLSMVETAPGGTTVTIAIANGSLASISLDPNVLGGSSVVIPNITNALPTIYLQGLAVGTTTLTYSAPGYKTVSGNFYISLASVGLSSSLSLNVATADPPYPLTLVLYSGGFCNSGGTIVCFLSPNTSGQFSITSSNTAVGTVNNPLVMAAGASTVSGTFTGLSAGTTTLSVGATPAPFAQPNAAYGTVSISATVTQSRFVPPAVTTGANLQIASGFSFSPPNPARTITVTSSNPAIALISTSASVTGAASVSFTSSSNVSYYVQGISPGTATLTLSAQGYADSSAAITVLPSGIVLSSTGGAAITTTAFSSPTTLTLSLAELNATTGAVYSYCGTGYCQPNPGSGFSIAVTSSNPAVGTISSSPVIFAAGAVSATTTFVPVDVGTTTISLGTQPAGMTAGAGTLNSGTTKVTGDTIIVPDVSTGSGLYVTEAVSLNSTPPRAVTMTVTLADPSLARLSTNSAVMGTATSLTFNNVSCLSPYCSNGNGPPLFYVQGVAPGYTKLIVTATGYTPSTATVAVYKAGITLYSISTQYVTGIIGNPPTNASGYLSLLDPYSQSLVSDCTGANPCMLNPGVVPAFSLTTNDPSIGTFGSSSTYNASTGFITIPYIPGAQGQTNYNLATQSSGFYNTTSAQRRMGNASTTVSGSAGITNALYITGHDIDAGIGLQVVGNFGLSGTVFGYDSTPYTVTVADPTIAVLSFSGTAAGSPAITETTSAYINNNFYVQGLKAGTTTITITGAQYVTRTITLTVRPAGFVIKQFDFTRATTSGNTNVTVYPAVLNDAGQWMANAQISPQTATTTVSVSSSNPSAGTVVASSVSFAPQASSGTITFHPVASGSTTLTLGTPSAPLIQAATYQSITATVP